MSREFFLHSFSLFAHTFVGLWMSHVFFLLKRREQTETKVAYMDRPVQVFSKQTVVES